MDNKLSSQPKIKIKNVNPYREIVTSDAVFEKVFENIQMQEQQRLKNAKRPKKSQKVETEFETDEETEEEEKEEEFSASNEDESNNTYEERVPEISFLVTMNERKTFLGNCWDAFSPPIPENVFVNAWCAGIFYGVKKKGTLYLGRITKRFLKEKDAPVDCFGVNCLKTLSAPSNTVLEEPPIHLLPDLGLFNSYNIIAGLLQSVTYFEGRKWRYMNYPLLYNYYKLVEKLDHKVIFNKYF